MSVRPKPATPSKRIKREAPLPSLLISRIKRQNQPYFNNHGNSQATAQSNSHAHEFSPFGYQTADALAGAQGKSGEHFRLSTIKKINYLSICMH